MMFTTIVKKVGTQIFPDMQAVDIQHFVYFVTFLIGVWALYHLAARWMSQNAAFGAALLFLTQPVFWGHAFINPKDISSPLPFSAQRLSWDENARIRFLDLALIPFSKSAVQQLE